MAQSNIRPRAVPGFINYPTPKSLEAPYTAPPPEKNPVFRGLPLYYLANVVASSSFIQNILWSNAGFGGLRKIKELDHVDNRYDPTVIPTENSAGHGQTENSPAATESRALAKDVPGRFYTVLDYHEAYKAGTLTPTDLVESLLPIIRRDVEKPTAHSVAFLETHVDEVRLAAQQSTERYKAGKPLGVLDGVPFAIKDEYDLSGYKRREGSRVDFSHKEDVTSWCAEVVLKEGAVLLGKTNMHELGMDTTNNNPVHGTPLNPHNEYYYTGGSSGGSGYVVGSGIVPFALGSDGGGSIRIPSQWCGIYGLKPSHSRVSISPSNSAATSTTVHGPMAANMADLELTYRVVATPDPSNPVSSLFAPPKRFSGQRKKVLGIYRNWWNRSDPSVKAASENALEYFKSELGYEVIDITLPFITEGQLAHAMTILAEAATAVPDVSQLAAANKVLLKVGSRTPSTDLLLAQKLRNVIMQHLAYFFQKHPGLIILTPTTPNAGWHIAGGKGDLKYGVTDGNMSIRSMEYVWLANFTGIPCITFPVGYADPVEGKGKIPIGLSGNGEWGSEDALIEFGYDGEKWLNEGLEGGRRRPEAWFDVLKARETDAVS